MKWIDVIITDNPKGKSYWGKDGQDSGLYYHPKFIEHMLYHSANPVVGDDAKVLLAKLENYYKAKGKL